MTTAVQGSLIAVEQQQTTSDDYYTPRWVFEKLGLRFDIDVCSPPGGLAWIPADRYFTKADDGLGQDWNGRIWMNPPFSHPRPWVNRFIYHRGGGVALLPFSNSKWFQWLWNEPGVAITTNIDLSTFVGGGIYMPCFLAANGPECQEAIARLGKRVR